LALVLVCLLSAGTAVVALLRLREAEQFLNQVNLEARSVSGATFFASPKQLFVGQALTRAEVVDYLKGLSFVQTAEPGQKGTYVLEGADRLHVFPRLPELRSVAVAFKHGRIASLALDPTPADPAPGPVSEAAIEPAPLGAFVTTISDDEASRMFVRRYVVQPADLMETNIFYAALASEDATFMSHHGVRYARLMLNLLPGWRGGGSTITAQVIKNAVSLDKSRTVTRKVEEMFLAAALESRMEKGDTFTLYANSVFLGGAKGSPNVYGFSAAAEEYFGKRSLKDLTLNEASILVAMLPKPSYFVAKAKRGDYEELTNWRNRVLRLMNYNWPDRFPKSVIEAAEREPVKFVGRQPSEAQPMDVISRSFVDFASNQQPLLDMQGLSPVDYSGLHVYCSVDTDLMRESHRILSRQIPLVERRFPPARGGDCGDGSGRDRMLGAIVALDPRTGEVLSMYGGAGGPDGAEFSKFALNAKGAPASTIKPFWVTLSLAAGRLRYGERYTAASVIDPHDAEVGGWSPRVGVGGAGRVRTLLSASRDDFSVFNFDLVGFERASNFYRLLTGASANRNNPQLSIGFGAGSEVTPLQLARAYSIYSLNGALANTTPVSRVYLNGAPQKFNRMPPRQVVDAGAAFITGQLLKSVLGQGPDGRVGTARAAFARAGLPAGTQIGGKTGSGPNDVWMVSVSPRLVVVVWLGYKCHSDIVGNERLFAADTAAMIWAEFISSVQKYRPDLLAGKFETPASVTTLTVDPREGCASARPGAISEFFIKGAEPMPCAAR
jgi:penicillin-binding protein 1A